MVRERYHGEHLRPGRHDVAAASASATSACDRAASAAGKPQKLGLLDRFRQVHDRPAVPRPEARSCSTISGRTSRSMREFLAMAVYRRIGEPAPRESFAKVYINNVYEGLYAIVEDVTEAFVTRTIGDTGGYLYEYKYRHDFFMGYPGDDYATYRADVRAEKSRARLRQHPLRAAPSVVPGNQRRRRRGLARTRGGAH